MNQKFIPASVLFDEWRKAPEYGKAYDALEDEFARAQMAIGIKAITDGNGRVKVGDTDWSARGSDAAVGAKVRVIGADGAVLLVEGL